MEMCNTVERVRSSENEERKSVRGITTSSWLIPNPGPPSVSEISAAMLPDPRIAFSGDRKSTIVDRRVDMSQLSKEERKRCYKLIQDAFNKKVFKPVKHDIISWSIVVPGDIYQYSGRYIRVEAGKYRWTMAAGNWPTDANILAMNAILNDFTPPVPLSVTPRELRAGFARLRPDSDDQLSGFSLPNFILELKDLKSVVRLKDISGNYVDDVGGKFVGVNFGVLPFMDDINRAMNMMDSIDKYLDRWNDFALKGQIIDLHTTLWNFSAGDHKDHHYESNPWIHDLKGYQNITSIAKLHMYIRPLRVTSSQRFKQKLRSLGLTKPLGVAWEALPFSWLVDYFLNIQALIAQFEKEDSLFQFEVIDSGYSILLEDERYVTDAVSTLIQPSATNVAGGAGATKWRTARHYERFALGKAAVPMIHYQGDDLTLTTSFSSPHQTLLGLSVGMGMRR